MSSKRELVDTGADKRYVRRDDHGKFKASDDQAKSLGRDVQQPAKSEKPKSQGDKGD
ncbi:MULTISPECIES: hypothetical protein [Sphingomonas]|uniref:hypothetical protein n=1 Tax=Sphingomonas TaxID=13687 RepID=UPI0014473518|nr:MULTISPECIES: hypothetical protein [Sphingomonas]